jgi:dienelactone hydrolase
MREDHDSMWNPEEWMRKVTDQVEQGKSFSPGMDDWMEWQSALRARFMERLGGFEIAADPFSPVQLEERKVYPGYYLERVEIGTFDGLRMPMYVLGPAEGSKPSAVAIAVHGHGYGSREIVGLLPDGSDNKGDSGIHRNYGIELAKRGMLVLCPELMGFGDRRLPEDAAKGPKENSCYRISAALLMAGRTIAGVRIRETIRAIDYALSLYGVDEQPRIGVYGLSGGGLVAGFTAALDERVEAAVVCGFTNTFEGSILAMRHCLDNYIPGILQDAEMPDLLGLIAPRPFMIESGRSDRIFPLASTLQAIDRLESIYRTVGAEEQFRSYLFDGGHEVSGEVSFDWLRDQLME